ncbi:uncharacterized protein N7483_010389 [Penicillium malachiteum]|uniref:uncharacterized protein n=1 Tax=Penicillium malachiteum TaxID=1324776 RepID=UPI0025479331|nr:uncharacterized protein N7483_010389 [Penicillium malachiteum]KAJ5713208.1 hypothetical protein N7483_010389 [Penicillium malachiteum]
MFGPYEKEWDEMYELFDEKRGNPTRALGKLTEMSFHLDNYEVLRAPRPQRERGPMAIMMRDQIMRDPKFERNLHFLSVVLRETNTRNPEDKIFCILPSLHERERELITTGRAKSVSEVFVQATYASIASTGSLEILSLVPSLSSRKDGSPTWAVDFTFPEKYKVRSHHFPSGGRRERLHDWVSGPVQVSYPFASYGIFEFSTRQRNWCHKHPEIAARSIFDPHNHQNLALTGLEFDYIQDTMGVDRSATLHNLRPDLTWVQGSINLMTASSTSKLVSGLDSLYFDSAEREVKASIKKRASHGCPYNQIGTFERSKDNAECLPNGKAVRFTMLAALFRVWDKLNKPPDAKRKESLGPATWTQIKKEWSKMNTETKAESGEDKVFDKSLEGTEDTGGGEWFEWFCNAGFLLLFYLETREASFFVTGAGFLGVGPADLKPDDKIVLFYGSRYPIALRRSPQGSKW